jgi:hypothetical protein
MNCISTEHLIITDTDDGLRGYENPYKSVESFEVTFD